MLQRRKLQDGGVITDEASRVLPHYDEEEREEQRRKQARITLAGDGGMGKSKEERLEEIRDKLAMRGKTQVSLEVQKVSHMLKGY
jgi:hypothetical protein